jgi:phage repressor protein C with HTH and peptisase S24 domain
MYNNKYKIRTTISQTTIATTTTNHKNRNNNITKSILTITTKTTLETTTNKNKEDLSVFQLIQQYSVIAKSDIANYQIKAMYLQVRTVQNIFKINRI